MVLQSVASDAIRKTYINLGICQKCHISGNTCRLSSEAKRTCLARVCSLGVFSKCSAQPASHQRLRHRRLPTNAVVPADPHQRWSVNDMSRAAAMLVAAAVKRRGRPVPCGHFTQQWLLSCIVA
jgi:hypothetical protein